MDFINGAWMHKDNKKEGLSGMSQNEAFSLPESWGGHNCFLEVDKAIVRELKEAIGGEKILDFVSVEFLQHIQAAYDTLGIEDLNIGNIWHVFHTLYPLVFWYQCLS